MLNYTLAHFQVFDSEHKPLPNATVIVRGKSREQKDMEVTARTSEDGSAIFGVPLSGIPMLPTEADYEVIGPNGSRASGKVRVGGNEHVAATQVTLKVA